MERNSNLLHITSSVRPEALKLILKSQWRDPKTRINDDALRMMGEVVQLFVVETAARSSHQASLGGSAMVDMEHVEKVLPKLLLDF